MVPIPSLWLPILLSAVFVFIASSLLHMLLPFHRGDLKRVPAEDEVMEALRKFDIPPGDYMVPCMQGMSKDERSTFAEKYRRGPALMMTVFRRGNLSMGPSLAKWFVYLLVVGVLAVPSSGAQDVADRLVAAGVKIIFNYSEQLLQVPPDVTVHTSSPAVDLLYALYFYLA